MEGMTVYKHTNLYNQKSYIGITSLDPEKRWLNGYGYVTNKKFYEDIVKYGWDAFSQEILATNVSVKEAEILEAMYIEYYDSFLHGYNNNIGGSGFAGCHHTDEAKERIKAKISGENNPNYKGKNCNESWRKKQSESHKGTHHTEEHKRKITEGLLARHYHHTEEFKQQLAQRSVKKIMRDDGKIYNSRKEAAEDVGVSGSAISNSILRNNKCKGYYWSYIEA